MLFIFLLLFWKQVERPRMMHQQYVIKHIISVAPSAKLAYVTLTRPIYGSDKRLQQYRLEI